MLGDPVTQPRDVLVRRPRVDDDPEEIVAEEIHDQVVEHRAVGFQQAGIERFAAALQLVDVVREHVPQERASAGTLDIDDAHVRDVEHPGIAAHGAMLIDLGAVIHGHVPSAEIHHARSRGAVQGVKRCLFVHAGFPSEKQKGEAIVASPRLSLLPERLRRAVHFSRRAVCPFGGPPPYRRDRSPDANCVRAVLVA